MEFFRAGSGFLIQHFKWIRIQSGSRVLMIKNWRKNTSENFLYLLWPKIAIYVCPSLQSSKENIQHVRKWRLFYFFYVCGHFCPPPGSGYGSRDSIESESTTLEFLYIFFTFRPGIFLPNSRRDTRLKQWARWNCLWRGFLRCRSVVESLIFYGTS